ncbi:MAG: Hsp20/alpha crystallin family protein [Sulfolobaceae archaeon]|nr:Hsp20/alpha crystallin family protein [Sulfolobaceae archaeon]
MPKKKKYEDIFDYIDDIFEEFEEQMKEFEREFERFTKEGKGEVKTFGPYVYGFRITVGPDGKPKIEEFGNVVRKVGGRERPLISEEREPLVDIIEKDDEIRVIAEMPGVEKDNIKVKVVEGNKLVLQASSEDRKYYKEVELPAEVDDKSAKATYKNGVLEVVLKKKQPKEEKGTEIKVE